MYGLACMVWRGFQRVGKEETQAFYIILSMHVDVDDMHIIVQHICLMSECRTAILQHKH